VIQPFLDHWEPIPADMDKDKRARLAKRQFPRIVRRIDRGMLDRRASAGISFARKEIPGANLMAETTRVLKSTGRPFHTVESYMLSNLVAFVFLRTMAHSLNENASEPTYEHVLSGDEVRESYKAMSK